MNKEELFEFLKQEGISKRFERNIRKYIKEKDINEESHYESVFWSAEQHKSSPIKSAFKWVDTLEGYDYWEKIAEKHLKTINYE